jgi:hypothetical protein
MMSAFFESGSFPRGGLLATGAKESYEAFAKKNAIAVTSGGAALAKVVWEDFKVAGFNVAEDIKYLSDNQGTRYFIRAGAIGHMDLGQDLAEYEITVSGWSLRVECSRFDITHNFNQQETLK